MKGQKKEILTRTKSRQISRPDVFYFLPGVYSDAIGTHFLKQLPTHNGSFAIHQHTKPTLRQNQKSQFLSTPS